MTDKMKHKMRLSAGQVDGEKERRERQRDSKTRQAGREAGVSDPDRNLKTVIGGPDAVLSLPALYFSFSLCSAPADEGQSQKVLFVIFWIRQISGSSCCSLGWQIESAEETKAKEKNQTWNTCCYFAWSLLLSLSLFVFLSHLSLFEGMHGYNQEAYWDETNREDKGNVKKKKKKVLKYGQRRRDEGREQWRDREREREMETEGFLSILLCFHWTVFQVPWSSSYCVSLSLSLFFLLSHTETQKNWSVCDT